MRVLALVVLLAACGDATEAPAPLDMGRPDLVDPYVDEEDPDDGTRSGGNPMDRCRYALCNNPMDRRTFYTDPAPFQPQSNSQQPTPER